MFSGVFLNIEGKSSLSGYGARMYFPRVEARSLEHEHSGFRAYG